MAIQVQSFGTIVNNAVTAIEAASRQLLDFTIGSVLRAVVEATSAMALWLQAMALQIASLSRFSTSNGADADSFGADFNFPRLGAKAATGPVTFARFTPTNPALVAVGKSVQTADGSQQYLVIADATQAAYDPAQQAYVIPAGVSSVSATVQAVAVSSAGNAAAGFVNTLGQSITGVDTVTNPIALQNGRDAESDPAYKARFILYIAGLAKATPAAIESAVLNIQQDVTDKIIENQNLDGTANKGFFFVMVDDGSGAPPSSFLAAVGNAVEATRPIGSSYAVFGPTVITATVAMTITVSAGYDKPSLAAQAQAAITAYISGLTFGETLPYNRLSQIAFDVSPGITNVTGIALNGLQADLVPTAQQEIRAGSVTVS